MTRHLVEAIRQRRLALNYTQEYLAMKLMISQNAYSKIELGYTKITIERLFDIAVILELTPAELLRPVMRHAMTA